jgi:hypothetical protein
VDNQSLIITRSFWTLFTIETIAWSVLMFWTPRGGRGWGPEGPVGGWLIYVVPPIMLGIPLAIVLIGRSRNATLCGLIFVAWPLVPVIVGPVYSVLDNFWTDRSVAGDLNFLWPSQRRLAHALQAHDLAQVRTLLPKAGNLNQEHRGQSLFAFALDNVDKSDASLEIMKAMLDRGANPNLVTSNRAHMLIFSIGKGPAITKLLLDAGADPNHLEEGSGRPVWWQVLYDHSPEAMQTLTLLLDHGADVIRRDTNNGPVGWAASLKNWPAVWILMERGASWKNELSFGQPILAELESDLRNRGSGQEIPEEVAKIRAKYEAEQMSR